MPNLVLYSSVSLLRVSCVKLLRFNVSNSKLASLWLFSIAVVLSLNASVLDIIMPPINTTAALIAKRMGLVAAIVSFRAAKAMRSLPTNKIIGPNVAAANAAPTIKRLIPGSRLLNP